MGVLDKHIIKREISLRLLVVMRVFKILNAHANNLAQRPCHLHTQLIFRFEREVCPYGMFLGG